MGVGVDSSDNIFVAGYSTATWGSPLRAHSGGNDVFVAKLDGSGTLLWNTFLGGAGTDDGDGIAVDPSGTTILVTGRSNASWGTPVRAYSASDDAFAARLDSGGALLWHTFLGGTANDYGMGITMDSSGNVFVRGCSNATWGSPFRAHSGNYDVYVAKLNGSGTLLWNTFLGGAGSDSSHGSGIALDSPGNIFVGGYTLSISWGSPIRAHSGDYDAFAAKLDGSGALLWNTFLGGSGSDNNYGIALDPAGNVLMTGDSDASWGGPLSAHHGGLDVYVAKLDGNGILLWNTFLGGSNWDYVYNITADPASNILVSGKSVAAWGSPLRAYTGGEDGFVAKLSGSGAFLWNTFLGGSGTDLGFDIDVSSSGSIAVMGNSSATLGQPASGPLR